MPSEQSRERARDHAVSQFGEGVDPGHVERMAEGLDLQAELIADIRSHLTAEENAVVGDGLIWQRAVKFGPDTPEGHAKSLRDALKAADEYVADLAAELGISEEASGA